MTKSIYEIENEITDEFSFFADWQDKYEYIIELGKKLKDFPEDKRTAENMVKGCQSSVWLVTERLNGSIVFKADSDSTIVKGLIALLIRVLSGKSSDEIVNAKLEFIDKIGLRQHLAQTRANGLAAMIKQMKMYAIGYKTKEQLN
ncbi:MAG: SufE family protein [Chlorobi bacterium]|nr:SufE family protein [Chlorobiota bacterium]MCI0716396.1 SufE family protein [Chlorobiota bacterium]